MAERERSSEEIRENISREGENISQTVEQIGERIKETFDWRAQVKDSPYLATGAAIGVGYVASRVFARRATRIERILESLADDVHDSLGGSASGVARTGLIKMTVLGIVTRAAAGWIKSEYNLASGADSDVGPRPRTGQNTNIDPETNM